MASGALAQKLAQDSADGLAVIEDRAAREATTTMRVALAAVLVGLRRAFLRYQEATANPGSVSPAELTARYQEVVRAAQRFLTDGELNAWEAGFRRHLEAAIAAGAKAAELVMKAEDPGTPAPPFSGPDPVLVEAQLRAASASVRSEAAGFRDRLVALVGAAALAGWGVRRLQREARLALEGIPSGRGAGGPGRGAAGGAGRGPAAPGPAAPGPGPAGGPGPSPAAPAGAPGRGPGAPPPPPPPPRPQAPRRITVPRRPQAGVINRVLTNIRTNLQQASQQTTQTLARAAGYQYVRWIATRDERTCAYCVARHGRIYRLDEAGVPAHVRCRCRLQPLSTDDVENPDPDARERALNGNYWRQSQTRAWREYAASRGRSTAEVRPELLRAANTPTANERWRTPGTRTTAQPAVTLDGPGGMDLTSAVRASNANRQQSDDPAP